MTAYNALLTVVRLDEGMPVISMQRLYDEVRIVCFKLRQAGLNEVARTSTAALRAAVDDCQLAQLPHTADGHCTVAGRSGDTERRE